MALSGKRLSRSSKRRRASHFALAKKQLTACSKCKRNIASHRACPYCGTYKSREVTKLRTPRLHKEEKPKENNG